MIPCPACRTDNAETNRFCGSCGARMNVEAVAAAGGGGGVPFDTDLHARPVLPPRPGSEAGDQHGDPLVGQVIADRYRILELIGRGGMGVVYKVEHVGMGKLMAMKLLHGELSRDREIVKRFKREAQAASLLKHVNTVSIFDFGRSEGLMYLVMEYIDGIDLGRLIRTGGPMPAPRLAGMIAQACGSLAEAHEVGIVHRDLKPENVIVTQTRDKRDFVKVLDFGLAKLRETEHQLEITSQGSLIGTPYYMAPEQIRGEAVDGRTDLYALGALMYKALSGSPAFSASTPVGVLTRHLTENVVPLRDRFPELSIPADVDAIVMRAMAKLPQDRYQRADEVRHDLVAFLEREGVDFTSADGWKLASISQSHTGRPSVSLPSPEPVPVGGRAGDRLIKVATREEFDRYETRLRRGKYFWWFMLLLVLMVAGGAGAWAWQGRARIMRSDTEKEPNDVPDQANTLWPDLTTKAYLGRRHSPRESDRDWFRIDNPGGAPRILRVEVSGIPNMDVVVEVVEPGDTQPLIKADNGGRGAGEVVSGLRVSDTSYYLLVRELWVSGQPPTENVSDPYTVKYVLSAPGPDVEVEPNDSLDRAGVLAPGVGVRGTLIGRHDLDNYCLASPVLGTSADVSLAGVPDLDLVLRVVDPGRSESRVVDQGGIGAPEQFTGLPLAAGRPPPCFEVSARSGVGAQQNALVPYALTVTVR